MNTNDVSVAKSSIVSLKSTHMKFKLQTPRRLKATSNLSKPASVFTLRISYSSLYTHKRTNTDGVSISFEETKTVFSYHLSVELQARNKLQYRVKISGISLYRPLPKEYGLWFICGMKLQEDEEVGQRCPYKLPYYQTKNKV